MRTAAPPRTPTHASGYLTGLTTNEVEALLEQVENFFLSLTAVGALGGNTFIPEAPTGLRRASEKFPVSTIPTEELCCLPGAKVTVRYFDGMRLAALPICLPFLPTADTPGYPRRVQLLLLLLTNFSG